MDSFACQFRFDRHRFCAFTALPATHAAAAGAGKAWARASKPLRTLELYAGAGGLGFVTRVEGIAEGWAVEYE